MTTTDYAEVAVKPPILFLGALALGCLLSSIIPIGPGLGSANGLAVTVGLTFIVLGFVLAGLSFRNFRLAGTSVVPGEPAKALVVTGPYHVTRNPIYIGLVLAYFGVSILLTSMWVLLLLIPAVIILQRRVVLREEEYLERQFGEAYTKYKARVPRWL
jgi:protein-S-isoprenylcysteine O-methyltransferase Ste14